MGSLSLLPHALTALGHIFQFGPQLVQPHPDMPPVGLQLLFTGPPGADAAAGTCHRRAAPQSRHGLARADQPGQPVTLLGEFYLQGPLPGEGVLGEYIEDEHGPIQHLAVERFFQAAYLGGGELIVAGDAVGVQLCDPPLDLQKFPLAHIGDLMGGGALLAHHPRPHRPRRYR